jgi:xanthine dehydrogenase accessory factor
MAVRRCVAFAQAVFDGKVIIEDVHARRIDSYKEAEDSFNQGLVAVMVDPELAIRKDFQPHVLIDGRMRKIPPDLPIDTAPLVIGLGPGFTAGKDCHAVIETKRGPFLGRVIWRGQAQPDTGVPERVGERQEERVLRAPADGDLVTLLEIGAHVKAGQEIARVAEHPVLAPFDGVIRGLLADGISVYAGVKIGDVDPRGDALLSRMVSDKALAIGGGVLEAILSWMPLRQVIYAEAPSSTNVDSPDRLSHSGEGAGR